MYPALPQPKIPKKKSALHRYCVCNSAVGASACCLQELGSCPLVALIDGCEPPVSRVTVLGGVRDSASGVRLDSAKLALVTERDAGV